MCNLSIEYEMGYCRQKIANEIYDNYGIDISHEAVDRSILLFYRNVYHPKHKRYYINRRQVDWSSNDRRRPIVAFERRKYTITDLLKMMIALLEEQGDSGESGESGTSWWSQYKKDIGRDRVFDAIQSRSKVIDEKRLYSQVNQDLIKIRESTSKQIQEKKQYLDNRRKADEISLSSAQIDINLPIAERLLELGHKRRPPKA